MDTLSYLNPYTVFDYEIHALYQWHKDLLKGSALANATPRHHTRTFLDTYCPSPYWSYIDFSFQDLKQITKKEKILYFHSLGFTNREIQKAAGASPNTIQTVIKTPRTLRHTRPDEIKDHLIKVWTPFKEKIPQEIFIKYI